MNKHIVLIGMKSAGKSTIGKLLADKLARDFVDTDIAIESLYQTKYHQTLSFSTIHKKLGKEKYHALEYQIITEATTRLSPLVIAVGGSSLLYTKNIQPLVNNGWLVYLQTSASELLSRWQQHPPSFIDPHQLAEQLTIYYRQRVAIFEDLAQAIIQTDKKTPSTIAHEIAQWVVHL